MKERQEDAWIDALSGCMAMIVAIFIFIALMAFLLSSCQKEPLPDCDCWIITTSTPTYYDARNICSERIEMTETSFDYEWSVGDTICDLKQIKKRGE